MIVLLAAVPFVFRAALAAAGRPCYGSLLVILRETPKYAKTGGKTGITVAAEYYYFIAVG